MRGRPDHDSTSARPDHPWRDPGRRVPTPLGISQYRLAQATGLSQTHIGQIIRGKRRITPDAGLRIARALGVSDRYWIDLQTNYDTIVVMIANADQTDAVRPIVAG